MLNAFMERLRIVFTFRGLLMSDRLGIFAFGRFDGLFRRHAYKI